MARPSPQRSYRTGLLRRERILTIADELLSGGDPDAVVLTEVANRVGTTRAGVLHHFASRDDLLVALLERRLAAVRQDVLAAQLEQGWTAFGLLRALMEASTHAPETFQLYAVLAGTAVLDESPARLWFQPRNLHSRELMVELLTTDVQQQRLRSIDDIETLATTILATLDGLQLWWLIDPDNHDLRTTAERYLSDLEQLYARP